MGPRGILLCSFLPKGSKTSQEIAEIWNFPTERLRDSIENHLGQKGMLGHSFVPKISKIGQDLTELLSFFPERLRDSIENHMGQKSGSFRFNFTKNIQNRSRNGLFWVIEDHDG